MGHPLPATEHVRFQNQLRQLTIEQLNVKLQEARLMPRALLIIDELGSRTDHAAAGVLRHYEEQLSGNDVVTVRLRGATRVALAMNEAKGDAAVALHNLEQHLRQPTTSGAPGAAALKLKEMGGSPAIEALRRAERPDEPLIKLERLELEYAGLGDEEFVNVIMDSVRDSLRRNASTVAESSALAHRGPRLIPLLNRAAHQVKAHERADLRPRLAGFLQSVIAGLQRQTPTTAGASTNN
jgi:hypothetical protein